jgi:DNA-binding FadR family transcriptional regulator
MTKKKTLKSVSAAGSKTKPEHGTSMVTAFREIRELIVHGRMSPGTWILEADLAERLNMSRTPIRGAIHWLQRAQCSHREPGVCGSLLSAQQCHWAKGLVQRAR